MNAKVGLKMNNQYHAMLVDAKTGKIKQECKFHNMTLFGVGYVLSGSNSASESVGSNWYLTAGRWLECGSGTTAPQYTDTGVATLAFGTTYSYEEDSLQDITWIDDYTVRKLSTYTFPADANHVGTVTEIALYFESGARYARGACNRALLTDSEGHQISFNKTADDMLIINLTMEMSLTSSDDSFHIFKKSFLLCAMAGLKRNNIGYYGSNVQVRYGTLCLAKFDWDLENYSDLEDYIGQDPNTPLSLDTEIIGGILTRFDTSVIYMRYPTARMATTNVPNERYFKAVVIPSVGYWKLPNEDIFPAYTIQGLSIGTGDGSKTDFENPLCYFKANTDKVYKNGVQLTRGVDYTINNRGNKSCLPEVCQNFIPTKVSSNIEMQWESVVQRLAKPFFLPSTFVKSIKLFDMQTEAPIFDASSPLYVEYANPITANCFSTTPLWYIQASGVGAALGSITLYIDYSLDGETYTQCATLVSPPGDYSVPFTMADFDAVTARYWRVRTSYSYGSGSTKRAVALFSANSQTTDVYIAQGYFGFAYKDPYIKFSVAPAAGDILTMDVDMDVIMKNENFVVDVTARIDFSV